MPVDPSISLFFAFCIVLSGHLDNIGAADTARARRLRWMRELESNTKVDF
jgi:hypothetical protein